MNVLRIAFKEFRQQMRDWRTNSLMILFPLVLMAILGAALQGAFSTKLSLSDVKLSYRLESAEPMSGAFGMFVAQVQKTGMRVGQVADSEAGKAAVRDGGTAAFIDVRGNAITLYRNERNQVESGIIQSMLNAFLIRYNSTVAVVASGHAPPTLRAEGAQSVEVQSILPGRKPRAIDFYAVTMLTLIIMYASLVGLGAIREEIQRKTGNRILTAPVGRLELLVGKTVGALIVVAAQVAVVILFSRYVLGAYWGTDPWAVALLVGGEAIMAVAVGAAIAYVMSSQGAAVAVLNIVIPVFVFLGGGYVPLDVMGPSFENIAKASPITWINKALFGVIYSSDYSGVGPALLVTGGAAALFLIAAGLLARRERT